MSDKEAYDGSFDRIEGDYYKHLRNSLRKIKISFSFFTQTELIYWAPLLKFVKCLLLDDCFVWFFYFSEWFVE